VGEGGLEVLELVPMAGGATAARARGEGRRRDPVLGFHGRISGNDGSWRFLFFV
jgi:hypothetical protein